MQHEVQEASAGAVDDLESLTIEQVCIEWGGKARPVNRATIYNLIKRGILPKPFKIGPNMSRWTRADVISAKRRAIAARDATAPEAA